MWNILQIFSSKYLDCNKVGFILYLKWHWDGKIKIIV